MQGGNLVLLKCQGKEASCTFASAHNIFSVGTKTDLDAIFQVKST